MKKINLNDEIYSNYEEQDKTDSWIITGLIITVVICGLIYVITAILEI